MNDLKLAKIERRTFLVRGQKVMLDFDLAELYGVETRALKQAGRRNLVRFQRTSCSNSQPPRSKTWYHKL
jgi:hypothetical protein